MQDKTEYPGNPLRVEQEPFIPNAQQANRQDQQTQQNQQNQQNSQIVSKDLTMIEDMLNHEAMAYKKCSVCADCFTDQALTNMAQAAAAHHKQHFEALQSYMCMQK